MSDAVVAPGADGIDTVTVTAPGPETSLTKSGQRLWLRQWSLAIGSAAASTTLSPLHFVFTVTTALYQTPWQAQIRIHNVGQKDMDMLATEYTQATLTAGYQRPSSQYGVIFDGQVAWYERGRENATDTYLQIYANQRDKEINASTINTTLPAGYTQLDVVKACAQAMGIPLGYVSDLGDVKSPRARALYGMARDVLRDVAQTANATSFIQDGKLVVLVQGDALPGSVVVLNSASGLIGVPAQTLGGGIRAVSLLNPFIRPATMVQINQADINKLTAGPGATVSEQTRIQRDTAGIAADGFYKVVSATHRGDNRGNPWFTEIVCVPIDPTQQGSPAIQAPQVH